MGQTFAQYMQSQQQIQGGFDRLASFDQQAKAAEAQARQAQFQNAMGVAKFGEQQRRNSVLEGQGDRQLGQGDRRLDQTDQRLDLLRGRLANEQGSRPAIWKILSPVAAKHPEHATWMLQQIEGLDQNSALQKLGQLSGEYQQRLLADAKRALSEKAGLHAQNARSTQDARFSGTKRIEDARARGYEDMVNKGKPGYQPQPGERIDRSPANNILTLDAIQQRGQIANSNQARRELASIRKTIRDAYGTGQAVSPATIAKAATLYEQTYGAPPASPEDLAHDLETTPDYVIQSMRGAGTSTVTR